MLEAWALKNWKSIAVIIVVVALFAAGGLGFWRGLVEIGRLQDKAATLARDAQDAKWQAQIAKANAAVATARADQAITAAKADAAARDAESRFQEQLNQLEKNDAALAGGADLVLRRDRVRVLDGARP
jgi:biopolymer transport protein ExbB/TolQ